MKIVCLGGGGLYFVRPVADFALCEELHGSTIVLYDIDRDRAELMAKMGRRFSRTAGARLRFRVAETLHEAVDSCDFVLTSIGGAGASGAAGYYDSPVHLGDKLICARHGVQQVVGDTAGPAAMMAAFRSIPIHLEICRAVSKYAPNAVLLNHANPMAVLCRAMIKYSDVQSVIGICHGVQNGVRHVAHILDVPPEALEVVWIGTNHYHWMMRLRYQGKDIMPRFRKRVREVKCEPQQQMCAELSDIYGHWIVYPEDDHTIEFYPYLSGLDGPDRLPFALSDNVFSKRVQGLWDGSETLEELRQRDREIDRPQMLKAYAKQLSEYPLPTEPENPILGEGTASLITDIAAGRRVVHICNVPNQGAVANLPAEALLEVEAVTDSAGVRPIWAGEAPLALEALLRKRIAWQEIVVDAGVTGNRKLALQAMQIDEGAIPPKAADKLLSELFANNKGRLPTFEKKSGKKR